MATDTESIMHDNMTRLRMKMVQQKLANEKDKLQRSESQASENGYEDQIKLKNAMLRKQELLDKIHQEQLNSARPKSYSPRRRYTASPLPLSRRSFPDINNTHYHIGLNGHGNRDVGQVKHVIEHQFRSAPPHPGYSQLPPITAIPQFTAVQPVAEVVPVQTIQPTYSYAWPTLAIREAKKDSMFNKSDFMDMMMLQNAQMHHMTMQQLMLYQLPGARPWSFGDTATSVALETVVESKTIAQLHRSSEEYSPQMRSSPSVYHHHINQPNYSMPPMDYLGGGFRGYSLGRNYNSTIYDDGSNYYHYH